MKSTITSLLFTTWVIILNTNHIAAQSPINFTGDRVICNGSGNFITAHAEGACVYMWSTGQVGPLILVTDAMPYTVTVTDCNGNTSSASITIIDSKVISNLQLDLCKNSSASIIPVLNEGYWTANNPSIATITREGMMMAVDTGKTTFSYHYYDSECVADTKPFEVFPLPEVSSSKAGYCLEDIIKLSPSQGGTWYSMQTHIATIKNNGEGHPLAPGKPKFVFTSSETGCSQTLENVAIHPRPKVELLGNDTLCLYATTLIKPNSGGVWKGLNHSVGTVTNGGVITVIGLGTTQFQWLETSTGCFSELSPLITVIPRPKITTDLPGTICMGGNQITLPAPFTGTWTSSNSTIAKINQEGIIEIVKAGNVTFEIHAHDNSCSSEPITFTFQNIKPSISNHVVKPNSFIDLKTDAPGTWTSLDPNILRISENQKAVSLKSGKTQLEFLADAGCYAFFDIEVKGGKAGSNAYINPGGFTHNPGDVSHFMADETEVRKTEMDTNTFEINIYPNPSSDVIYFQSGQSWDRVQIHNLQGQLIWQSNGLIKEINTTTWQTGVYQVSFVQGGHRVVKKLIKI